MNNCTNYDISSVINPIKKPWSVGTNIVVILDKKLVEELEINEENTLLEEIPVDNGILLRVRKIK
jgi:hypothetical protein